MEYDESYHEGVHSYLLKNPSYYALRAKVALARFFTKISKLKEKKILEFGSGLGQNIYLLRNLDVSGFDISKAANDFAKKKGIKIIESEIMIRDNSYDIILSSHNLEHLDNPIKNLEFFNKKLKKHGLLLLALPVEKQEYSSLEPDMKNYHLYSWNFTTINNLLHKTGFEVLKNKFYFGTGFKKLSPFSKFSFSFYLFLVSLAGKITKRKELFIIARKR